MLKLELSDGASRFVNMDRVLLVDQHAETGLVLKYLKANGEPGTMRIKRFQIVKSGTWMS